MKGNRFRCTRSSMLLIWIMAFGMAYAASSAAVSAAASRGSAHASRGEPSVQPTDDENSLAGILGGITVPRATAEVFNGIYARHGSELTRILTENPVLVWDTLDILLDVLPALRAVPENRGRLFVTRTDYDRAAVVLQKFTALAGEELAGELQRAREMIDRRVKNVGDGKIVIDLN